MVAEPILAESDLLAPTLDELQQARIDLLQPFFEPLEQPTSEMRYLHRKGAWNCMIPANMYRQGLIAIVKAADVYGWAKIKSIDYLDDGRSATIDLYFLLALRAQTDHFTRGVLVTNDGQLRLDDKVSPIDPDRARRTCISGDWKLIFLPPLGRQITVDGCTWTEQTFQNAAFQQAVRSANSHLIPPLQINEAYEFCLPGQPGMNVQLW